MKIENQRLPRKVNDLASKVVSVEPKTNWLEQQGRRNNLEVTDIPDAVKNNKHEENVFKYLDVKVASNDLRHVTRTDKTKSHSKKTVAKFS